MIVLKFATAINGESTVPGHDKWIQTGGADAKGQVYLTIEMDEAIVSSYSMSSAGERPSESFSLNFTKITYNYDKYDGSAVTKGTPQKWDLEKNSTF